MSSFRLSKVADRQLDEIGQYLADHSPHAVTPVLRSLLETFEFLADNPGAGQSRDDLRPNLRVFTGQRAARNYAICFSRTRVGIEIRAVIHAAQDWERIMLTVPPQGND